MVSVLFFVFISVGIFFTSDIFYFLTCSFFVLYSGTVQPTLTTIWIRESRAPTLLRSP